MPDPKVMSTDDLLFMLGMLDPYFSYAENEHNHLNGYSFSQYLQIKEEAANRADYL